MAEKLPNTRLTTLFCPPGTQTVAEARRHRLLPTRVSAKRLLPCTAYHPRDAVNPSLASTSVASQSLRELFSRVLRDSDTPKTPQRRNSIDASEVEDSPRLERVWKERSSYKGKRRSMSDEEAEKSFGEYMSCILGRVVYEHEHPAATRSLPEERSPPPILSRSIRCPTTETLVNLFKVPLFRSYVLFRLPAP